jgi:hypothetical protein
VYSYTGGIRLYNYIAETKTVHLKQGMNTLLVKTLQTAGNHDFALNICEVETNAELVGNRVEGLKFYPTLTSTSIPRTTVSAVQKIQCSPNPASSVVHLSGSRPMGLVRVFDLNGSLIRTLHGSGSREMDWDLCDERGNRVRPGSYLVRETPSGQCAKILVRY